MLETAEQSEEAESDRTQVESAGDTPVDEAGESVYESAYDSPADEAKTKADIGVLLVHGTGSKHCIVTLVERKSG